MMNLVGTLWHHMPYSLNTVRIVVFQNRPRITAMAISQQVSPLFHGGEGSGGGGVLFEVNL
jgi:hypothetical protein